MESFERRDFAAWPPLDSASLVCRAMRSVRRRGASTASRARRRPGRERPSSHDCSLERSSKALPASPARMAFPPLALRAFGWRNVHRTFRRASPINQTSPSKSSRDIHIALRSFPCRNEKSIPSNCFLLKINGSSRAVGLPEPIFAESTGVSLRQSLPTVSRSSRRS